MKISDILSHFVLKYLVVPKSPKILPDKTHIACIGDSITYGAGVKGRTEQTISGRTLQDEGDYPYRADKFYSESLNCSAEIYLIMLGTNDAKPYNWNVERYEREFHSFCKEYRDLRNHPRVIVMTPPQCYADPKTGKVGFDINAETIDRCITGIIKRQAENLKLEVIDLHELTQNHEDWFDDGVHPNALGNQMIAEHLAVQLTK